MSGETTHACVDPDQMHQVVFNLCENALRHSPAFQGDALVELRTGTDPVSGKPVVDVIDHGSGIPPETADKIFEPFYTGSPGGTGLGLYIARELCEGNGGGLDYYPVREGGSRFHATLARPEDCDR